MPGFRAKPAVIITTSVWRVGVVVRASDVTSIFHGKSLLQIQRLALRHAFDYIDHHHVAQFLGISQCACSDRRYLRR